MANPIAPGYGPLLQNASTGAFVAAGDAITTLNTTPVTLIVCNPHRPDRGDATGEIVLNFQEDDAAMASGTSRIRVGGARLLADGTLDDKVPFRLYPDDPEPMNWVVPIDGTAQNTDVSLVIPVMTKAPIIYIEFYSSSNSTQFTFTDAPVFR